MPKNDFGAHLSRRSRDPESETTVNKIPKPVAIGLAIIALLLLIFGVRKAISGSSTGLPAPVKPPNENLVRQHLLMKARGMPMGTPPAAQSTPPSGP